MYHVQEEENKIQNTQNKSILNNSDNPKSVNAQNISL